MKYDSIITNLAIVGGLLGLAGVSYSQPAQPETPRQQALQRLREEGATVDNTVQCVDIDYHAEFLDPDPLEVQGDTEYAALEKHFFSLGEDIVYLSRVNQWRKVLTVKDSGAGNSGASEAAGSSDKADPKATGARAAKGNIYAYSTVNFWEAYSGERKVYCVQSALPSDLTLVEADLALSEAYIRLDKEHEAARKLSEQQMDKQRSSLEQRLRERKDGTQRKLEQTKKEWEEGREQYRKGSLERVEAYRREHEQTRRQWYEEHGTLPAPLTDTPQADKEKNPPLKAGEGGAQGFERARREMTQKFDDASDRMDREFNDASDRIKRDYDGTSEEIRRRFKSNEDEIQRRFEEKRARIKERFEEDKKRIEKQ